MLASKVRSLVDIPLVPSSLFQFLVIDEKTVTPSSIVFLVVKLRLGAVEGVELDTDTKENEAKDYEFLNIRKDAEDISVTSGWAHAPYWPAVRIHLFVFCQNLTDLVWY